MHRKVIHFMPYMFVFSCQICRTGLCWDPKVLFPWQPRVLSIVQGAVSRSSCELTCRDRASKRGNRLGESRKKKTKQAKLLQWTTLWRFRLQVFSLCTDVPSFLRRKEKIGRGDVRFFPEGGGDVCTQGSRCSSWQLLGMKGTAQASGAVSTSAGTCWHNF